ncbi:hypothetical protein F5884DRAFT_856046 [Xylogone sp. PMI_703]|nr:hypothetical protein F5884DRAFT_856046 [Xylogone sp. PMI_703]
MPELQQLPFLDPIPSSDLPKSSLKRKTEDHIVSFSPQHRSLNNSFSFNPIISPPEQGSIYDIFRRYNGERLYMPPIAWKRQPQFLGCFFSKRDQSNKTVETSSPALQKATVQIASLPEDKPIGQRQIAAIRARNPFLIRNPNSKKFAIANLLASYNIQPFRWHFLSESVTPSLAYISLYTIRSLREKYIRTARCNRMNPPVAMIWKKKLQNLQPPNEAEDPYIVAILIALAQEQRRQQSHSTEDEKADMTTLTRESNSQVPSHTIITPENASSVFKVHVLAIPKSDARYLYVYAAHITPEFLDQFDNPSQFSPSHPVCVSYHDISLVSVEKLAKELYNSLCY